MQERKSPFKLASRATYLFKISQLCQKSQFFMSNRRRFIALNVKSSRSTRTLQFDNFF